MRTSAGRSKIWAIRLGYHYISPLFSIYGLGKGGEGNYHCCKAIPVSFSRSLNIDIELHEDKKDDESYRHYDGEALRMRD